MLLLTVYIFRSIKTSSIGNRKYLLGSLWKQISYSVSTFVQEKKMRSLQLEGKIVFLPPPFWEKSQQNHFNPAIHLEYSKFFIIF